MRKITMRDEKLPHQIVLNVANSGVGAGSGIAVSCNCGWKANRSLDVTVPNDHWVLYNSHLK